MSRTVKLVLAANLLVLAVLAFAYPQFMIAPGALTSSHRSLEADCFACHAPLRGVQAQNCMVCHEPAQIGRLTTAGLPVAKPRTSVPFHQELIAQDCLACHTDHTGVMRLRRQDRFDHALLQPDARKQCQACHPPPKDTLHQQITGNCGQCHRQDKWLPATFDHDRYFLLDRDHDTQCVTCHERNDYSRYTCYGCHEHTPANIRSKHVEEGIRNFANCVECHRSADEDDIRGGDGHDGDWGDDD